MSKWMNAWVQALHSNYTQGANMLKLNPYLRFDGNCREAFEFYQSCLGGELSLQTAQDSPMASQVPDEFKNQVIHASLQKDGMVLMGSDMMGHEDLRQGNAVTISLNLDNEGETKTIFSKLAAGGQITHPLKEEFWGGMFGMVIDKYGFEWFLNFQKEPNKA